MTIDLPKRVALRHEDKHRINLREDLVLTQRLQQTIQRDITPAGRLYQVTSLYFDTPYDSALREKIDGVNRREKISVCATMGRIPLYPAGEEIQGERPVREAQRSRLTPEQGGGFWLVMAAGYTPLLIEFKRKLLGEGLRPKTIICYHRGGLPYAPGNVRVTWTGYPFRLWCVDLNPAAFCLPVMDRSMGPGGQIRRVLPTLVRMAVQVPGRQAAACSKYALRRRFH